MKIKGIQIQGNTASQTYILKDSQVHNLIDSQMDRFKDAQIHSLVDVYKVKNTQTHRCTDLQTKIDECTALQTHIPKDLDV